MLQMDLPHLNVLTKIDKLSSYDPLPFNLDFYTEVQNLSYLLPHMAKESHTMANSKFEGLNQAIIELVEDFGLVSFHTLAVEDKRSMMDLLHAADRAGGYAFGSAEGANDTVWQITMREGYQEMDIRDVQERWLDRKDEFDEMEKKAREEARVREVPSLTDDIGDEGDEKDDFEEMQQ
jgi:GPN-loop GTPase